MKAAMSVFSHEAASEFLVAFFAVRALGGAPVLLSECSASPRTRAR